MNDIVTLEGARRQRVGIDYPTREMLKGCIEPTESAAIAVAHRRAPQG